MHAQNLSASAPETDTELESAIALVRTKAPETRFGRLSARRPANGGKYIQVNRVDAAGLVLPSGWTFLVDTAKETVVRTAVDPENFDPKYAVRHGMAC
ncbi:hypothetical protein OHB26_28090 [Nocardia sp. NBC_01503]|uniref:hypothetical protein n=1 Tax=Nocardia sp. NBC_01503 TaxID=2975997 RepID=UPI002E7B43BD|nr:hypothetical protein [Nocardia sp. NBC_01503]WTL30767.1 hypothetical protein OHB26_28090 [Nocardia sp. NBC_01503]